VKEAGKRNLDYRMIIFFTVETPGNWSEEWLLKKKKKKNKSESLNRYYRYSGVP